jgi:hypothetical protein
MIMGLCDISSILGLQWLFISIWNIVLPVTGRKISGAGTMFQIPINADYIWSIVTRK